ncbi:MAG: flagellar assembly protein FliW [Oscillospiraceae bacterium]|nr:flagellar assembly protein FliW [Oscillospiraceae bacterium]
MRINTVRFGEIDIADEKIVDFPEGLPGLEELKKFALITTEETEPFRWFQSMNDPDVALVVLDPQILFPAYSVKLPVEIEEELGIEEESDVLVLTVAVVPKDFRGMTTNLVSPIVINAKKNLGKQVIMQNSEYQIRQPIFFLLQDYINKEDDADAGSDAQG